MLVVLPVLFFAVPAAFGHPAIVGDNVIQNLPLRALTGRQLREGHLPLWNPYIWSGNPLLGGMNAGSFYPFTFLFALLAPVTAFVVNLLFVYWAAGLGMYALARQYGLGPIPSFLGALTYGFSGAMSGQIVHLGVIEGLSWIPLLVLAELRLSWAVLGTGPARADPTREGARRVGSPWPWVGLLALMVGLEALTGTPRPIAETEVLGAAIGIWLLVRPYAGVRVPGSARARFFGLAALAGAWGVALSAAQLAPGWSFIEASQRAVETYQYFGAGSLRVPWSLLLLVPDLFGTAGHFGSVGYFQSYNLPEVTGYVGLLPLGAALALLSRSFGSRRAAGASDWGMWLAIGGLGLLLTWGSFTPLGHVWHAIPLFGKTRLQSRNVAIVDLSLALLFAFWADRALSEPHGRPRVPALQEPRHEWRTWLVVAPAVAAVTLCAVTLAAPGALEEWLQVTPAGAALARGLWPWFLGEAVVAAGVVALVGCWRRLDDKARRRALVAVVVADLACFVLATSTAVAPPAVTLGPTRAAAAAVLGSNGRFAIVDTAVSHLDTLTVVGQPDLNVLTRLQSVQGYGSILSERYDAATGAHRLDTLSACALETGTFAPLRLTTVLAYAGDLAVGVGPGRPAPAAPAQQCRGAPLPGGTRQRTFYLGWPVTLSSASLVSGASAQRAGAPRVGVVTARGGTRWPLETVRRTPEGWSVVFRRPQDAAGIVVQGPARAISATSTVEGATGGRWALDGILQDALDTSDWRFVGTYDGTFGIFRRTTPPRPPVWLARPAPGSSVRQLAAPDWGGSIDRVVATRTLRVVWSQSYLPGWHASLTPVPTPHAKGRPTAPRVVPLTVRPDGLIQAVTVPPGTWTLRFSYRPRLLTAGISASLAGVAGFVALFVTMAARGRRRRRRRRQPGVDRVDHRTGPAPPPARREPVAWPR